MLSNKLIESNKQIIDNMKLRDMIDFYNNAYKQHFYFTDPILKDYFKNKLKKLLYKILIDLNKNG